MEEIQKNQVATKQDIFQLEGKIELRATKADLKKTQSNLDKKIEDSKMELYTEIAIVRKELIEKMEENKNEIVNMIDGFLRLHGIVQTEVVATQAKCNRLESHIQTVAKHVDVELDLA